MFEIYTFKMAYFDASDDCNSTGGYFDSWRNFIFQFVSYEPNVESRLALDSLRENELRVEFHIRTE